MYVSILIAPSTGNSELMILHVISQKNGQYSGLGKISTAKQ